MMTLALAFGRTLAELEATISGDELRWWKAFNRISPIGRERGDALMALSTSALMGAWVKKGPKPADLMPEWFKPPVSGMPTTKAELRAVLAKADALDDSDDEPEVM